MTIRWNQLQKAQNRRVPLKNSQTSQRAGIWLCHLNEKLQLKDWKAVNGCLRRLYQELDSEKNIRLMLQVLNKLVPADSLALQSSSLRSPLDLSAVTLPEKHSTPEQLRMISRYAHQSPYAAYYLSTWDAKWKMITDFMPLAEFHKTDLHRLALGPLGVNHQIFGVLGVFEDTAYAIAINRTHREFSERDREVLNTIHPHLVTSFFNALAFGRAQNSVRSLKAAMEAAPGAYAYFDSEGKTLWMQERAKAWLGEFFTENIAEGHAPACVRELIFRATVNHGMPQTQEQESPTEWLTICLGASPMGGWILRLERRPKTTPAFFRRLAHLSVRQNDVLRWMVEGKTNAEIATILDLSPRTVEKHVHAVLKALQVENRATAIVRAMEFCAAENRGIQSLAQ